jgi:hypothetical protein
VSVGDEDALLASLEAKAVAQFQQEFLQPIEYSILEIRLAQEARTLEVQTTDLPLELAHRPAAPVASAAPLLLLGNRVCLNQSLYALGRAARNLGSCSKHAASVSRWGWCCTTMTLSCHSVRGSTLRAPASAGSKPEQGAPGSIS